MSNIILAIDSSIDCCSVAIYKNQCIYSLSENCEKQHTQTILPMIQKILFKTKTQFQELNYIAFAKGPGNFTSIRIAASIANSFSISLNIPIISVSTLIIMAEQAWRKYKKRKIIVIINAKKKEVYWAKYKKNKQSIWIGENTESILQKELINDKINHLKNIWTLVGSKLYEIEYKNFFNIQTIKFFSPNAQDIIPLVLLKINQKIDFYSVKNNINYLYDNF